MNPQRWDDTLFTQLFNELYPGLCRYLEGVMGCGGGAQETAQEALLRLHRIGPHRIAPGEERFWVYRVATRLALHELRRTSVRERWARLLGKQLDSAAQTNAGPADRLERSELERRLHRAMHRLPARQRAILLLREWEGLAYAEIANLLGASLAKTKTDLFRARKALRAELAALTPKGFRRSTGTRA